ncbi:hypothetical protein EW145_g4585, partial [Phellinidium pouzarii]
PAAGGERFIVSAGSFIWQDWYDVGREAKIGGIKVPVGTPGAGKTFPYLTTLNSEKAKTVLKIEFRDKLATLRDTVEDFQARGW